MDKLYTVSEVATKLGLSDKTLRRWEDAGRFHSSRTLGNQRRYNLEDLQILDAIKHGVIPDQADLLTLNQAAQLAGVSPATVDRWEREGKIHPFVTVGSTFYPRHRLIAKLAELSQEINVQPQPTPAPRIEEAMESPLPPPARSPAKLSPLPTQPLTHHQPYYPWLLLNFFATLILLFAYHFLFNRPSSSLLSPSSTNTPAINPGEVRGVTTDNPKLDKLESKFQDHLAEDLLLRSATHSTINLDNTALITGSSKMPAGKNQISVTNDQLSPATPVTISFQSDYAPAKKYWVTVENGSFTVHTDFPVSSDSVFAYSFLATPSPTPSPTSTSSQSAQLSRSSAIINP